MYAYMQVPSCPVDYRLWQQTMYCQFGQKWAKLHHGPLWSVASSSQISQHAGRSSQVFKIEEVHVHIHVYAHVHVYIARDFLRLNLTEFLDQFFEPLRLSRACTTVF